MAVSVDGEIRLFQADKPVDYSVVSTNVCTDPYFNEIILSDDKKYLLYVNTDKDLFLLNIETNAGNTVCEGISCNETQFINNDNIQYSNGGDIYCYTISTDSTYPMIASADYHCNHGAVVSPDGSKIVFKDQVPTQNSEAVYAWAEVTGESVSTCTYLGKYEGFINLLELFEFIWIDNDTIFMKPETGLNNRILAFHDLDNPAPLSANTDSDGTIVNFTELIISNDRTKICVFGSYGLYQVDPRTVDLSSSFAVDEIYKSEIVTTKFAAYSADSDHLVVATDSCIGIYEAETLKQTDFDSTKIIGEGETLYALDCK